jgi:oligopeptidase A
MGFVRQLEFALFDMRLHAAAPPQTPQAVQALLEEVRGASPCTRARLQPLPEPVRARLRRRLCRGLLQLQVGRGPVVGRVRRFEEAGVLNPEIGARFRREVLAAGGSRPALESFVAFRGRKPQIDALLRHNGMTATA